jgi:hypothetical protein
MSGITHTQLEKAHELVQDYLQECYDNLPLHLNEQSVALAATGLVPTSEHTKFVASDDNPNVQSAWVLATCWFLRMMHPDPLRKAGRPLYKFLDEMELDSPAAWAETHNNVAQIIRDSGHDVDEFRQG